MDLITGVCLVQNLLTTKEIPAFVGAKLLDINRTSIYYIGLHKAHRYMNEMDIYPIYPKMNLSKRMQQAKVCPYLLQNSVIDAPNQAWSIEHYIYIDLTQLSVFDRCN